MIVGIAVVSGLIAFEQNTVKNNGDQLVVDGIRIATDAQAWHPKSEMYGGGAGSFEDLTLERIGWKTNAEGAYQNPYGTWELTSVEPKRFLLEGTAIGEPPFNTICIRVASADPQDIEAELNAETCSFD